MSNAWDQMREAVSEAKAAIKASDSYVQSMAEMIAGRLRQSTTAGSTLALLKRELRDFNIHTQRWKKKK